MKRLIVLLTVVIMAFAFLPSIASAQTLQTLGASSTEMLPPGVTEISDQQALLGVSGTYENAPAAKLLARVNAIRQEAVREGLADSYVPIKWSDALEYIAQIRSVEASVLEGHVRPKGGYVIDMEVNGIGSYGENLAWGVNALEAVELWYSEKRDLVKHTGGETGHYGAMIDPGNTHIGIGSFKAVDNWNCVCAEFTSAEGISESRTNIYGKCIQLIVLPKKHISLTLSGSDIAIGAKKTFKAKAVYNGHSLVLPQVNWTSSNTSVAAVASGRVTGKKAGSAVITAELAYYGIKSGMKASKKINVKPLPAKPSIKKLKKAKKAFTVKWRKTKGATGYRIQYSLKKSMKGAKTVKVGNVSSKKIKGLKAKKTYYVRIKAVNSAGSSAWSKIKRVKTR